MKRMIYASAMLVIFTSAAIAFGIEPGTHNLGSEHEKITRSAVTDLEPQTLSELAGQGEEPGAVGVPDDAGRDLRSFAPVHCDGGDFLNANKDDELYGQSPDKAQSTLDACRQFIVSHLDDAVKWAGVLNKASADDVKLDCVFNGKGTSAKCNTLEHLGLAFHAAQDFYAHTNWVDKPASGAISAENPPGLGNSGRAKWLDPRVKEAMPEGLISGCPGDMSVFGVTFGCEYGLLPPLVGNVRVLKRDLAKDTGPIGRGTGGTGTSPRGSINGNFSRAVTAAVEDTADKWSYFKEQLRAKYGQAGSAKILCMLRRDKYDPAACTAVASTSRTCAEREAMLKDEQQDDVHLPHASLSPSEISAADQLYASLRNYCMIEETDVSRHTVIHGGTSADALQSAKEEATRALAYWNACPAELKRNLTEMSENTKSQYQALESTSKADTKKEGALLSKIYANCLLSALARKQGN